MKKYEKPRIMMERFEMTQAIAGNCAVDMNYDLESGCQGHMDEGISSLPPGWRPFNDNKCDQPPLDDEYCYYPSNNGLIFVHTS